LSLLVKFKKFIPCFKKSISKKLFIVFKFSGLGTSNKLISLILLISTSFLPYRNKFKSDLLTKNLKFVALTKNPFGLKNCEIKLLNKSLKNNFCIDLRVEISE